MPNMYIVLYAVYIICGVAAALWLRAMGPKWLMFWSIAYVGFFTTAGLSMIFTSRALNNPAFEFVGQSLLAFFAVVGGALFSSAWNELRQKARAGVTNGG